MVLSSSLLTPLGQGTMGASLSVAPRLWYTLALCTSVNISLPRRLKSDRSLTHMACRDSESAWAGVLSVPPTVKKKSFECPSYRQRSSVNKKKKKRFECPSYRQRSSVKKKNKKIKLKKVLSVPPTGRGVQ